MSNMRELNGRYKRKSKARVILNWIIIALVMVIVISLVVPKTDRTEVLDTKNTQTDICIENESCKAKIENLAAQTLLKQEIETLTKEYESKLAELEVKLEQKRQEEMSLQ